MVGQRLNDWVVLLTKLENQEALWRGVKMFEAIAVEIFKVAMYTR